MQILLDIEPSDIEQEWRVNRYMVLSAGRGTGFRAARMKDRLINAQWYNPFLHGTAADEPVPDRAIRFTTKEQLVAWGEQVLPGKQHGLSRFGHHTASIQQCWTVETEVVPELQHIPAAWVEIGPQEIDRQQKVG